MEQETQIQVFSNEDLKKSGGFKKKNNVLEFSKTDFYKYLKENNLTIKSDYFDRTGSISNGKIFTAYYNSFIMGTSKIVEDFK